MDFSITAGVQGEALPLAKVWSWSLGTEHLPWRGVKKVDGTGEYFPFTLHFIPHFSLNRLGLRSHGCPSEGSAVSTLLKVSPCMLLSHFPPGPLHRSSLFISMILNTHIQTWSIAGRPICVQVAGIEMCVTVC